MTFPDSVDAYFEIADLHAFTTSYDKPQAISEHRDELVLDWLGKRRRQDTGKRRFGRGLFGGGGSP